MEHLWEGCCLIAHRCLTAKHQPPPNHPILERLPTLEVPPTECYLQFLKTLPSVQPLWVSSGSWVKKNYRTAEGEGVLDTTSQHTVMLESVVTYMTQAATFCQSRCSTRSSFCKACSPAPRRVRRLLHCLLCSPPAYFHPPAHEDPASWPGRRVSEHSRLWLYFCFLPIHESSGCLAKLNFWVTADLCHLGFN